MKLPARVVCLAAVAAALASSCAEPARVVAPEPQPPAAESPQGAVKALEWAVAHRSIDVLEGLFTEDFVFTSAGMDSAGNSTRNAMDRAWLLARFRCLFEGGGGVEGPPPAKSTLLTVDKNLVSERDTRPGYGDLDSLYRTVRTSVDFKLGFGDGSTVETTGYALFHLTRGDAAAIPADLAARGFSKDKYRWWITRWEDETLSAGGSPGATDPSRSVTLGALLRMYDCPPQFRLAP